MNYAEFKEQFGISEKQAEKTPPVSETSQDDSGQGGGDTETKLSLHELSKDGLLKFARDKKLYDKSFKEIEPINVIQIILEKARAKVVEAGLKTADEAAALAEDELFTLFDSIGK